MSLLQVYKDINCLSDKERDHKYISLFYNEAFLPYRDKEINILEIGVQYGHSLKLWESYFSKAKIYGFDIEYKIQHTLPKRVHVEILNAYSPATILFIKESEITFDIIIEDGPHTLETQRFYLKNYSQFIKPNGLMIMEDVYDVAFDSLKREFPEFTIIDSRGDGLKERNSVIFYKKAL